ncbi:MAG: hypothetical protein JO331_04710 [Verrucomicrobia bacterium]|nr:hypothetical protein [Verrucomicrobiota bacterium]
MRSQVRSLSLLQVPASTSALTAVQAGAQLRAHRQTKEGLLFEVGHSEVIPVKLTGTYTQFGVSRYPRLSG